ncbi:MAG: cell division protein FtsQ [Solirubrobacteraceae bacterium]|jgi:cell division protein FtsQ|nr:cell division protein FtsQ [Solirubrobacteraceae bacterium]
MVLAALVALLAAGAWMWVRDSPLVAVSDVTITGLSAGPESAAVRNALTRAARDMSTLHVRPERLRTAVTPYPIVKDIRVTTNFPHGMTIQVIEHDAVAAVDIDGRRIPVSSDGTLLRGRPAGTDLITLSIPTANGGGRLTSRRGLDAVAVMGAAPKALRTYVTDVARGPDGLRVTLRDGPLVQFGDAHRARAKWIAVARVLGDPRAAGATYLDVRVPERPVAGRFDDPTAAPALDGTAPDGTTDPSAAAATAADPTAGAASADTASADGTSTDGASTDGTATSGTSSDGTSSSGTADGTSTDSTSSGATTDGAPPDTTN